MFHHAIQALTALAPTRLLYTTSNRDASPKAVRRRRELYRSEMYWFHLDGRFRGANIAVLKEAFDQVFDGYEPRSPCKHGSEDCEELRERRGPGAGTREDVREDNQTVPREGDQRAEGEDEDRVARK